MLEETDVYEVAEEDGLWFCAMELCSGGSLLQHIPLPPRAVVEGGLQVHHRRQRPPLLLRQACQPRAVAVPDEHCLPRPERAVKRAVREMER